VVALAAHVLERALLLHSELERLLECAGVALWDTVGLVSAEDVLDIAPVLPPRRTTVAFLCGEERVVHLVHTMVLDYYC
jgi:hypothetical protein